MVSTLSGPIPPHPYYDKADPQSYLNLPQPRVRPEGEQYARQGSGAAGILLHVEGQRPPSALQSFRKTSKFNTTCTCKNFSVIHSKIHIWIGILLAPQTISNFTVQIEL